MSPYLLQNMPQCFVANKVTIIYPIAVSFLSRIQYIYIYIYIYTYICYIYIYIYISAGPSGHQAVEIPLPSQQDFFNKFSIL